ncbi:unnamed protein product [Closterium sp. NIES-65]|nr:unnamed protein product [Closterium sp. NIES-65]
MCYCYPIYPPLSTTLSSLPPQTEIMVMTALRHPNVLRLLGIAMWGQTISMVSEFVPGGDVSQRLEKAAKGIEPFPWKDRLSIAVGSVAGLAAIHKEGFIHRDFKAANVLLTKDLVPKVADFGLAKTCQDRTHVTTRVAGSQGYIDPSYFETGLLTEHCDTFAWGIFLLELLSGCCVNDRPFSQLQNLATDPNLSDYSQVVDKSLEGQWSEEEVRVVVFAISSQLESMLLPRLAASTAHRFLQRAPPQAASKLRKVATSHVCLAGAPSLVAFSEPTALRTHLTKAV